MLIFEVYIALLGTLKLALRNIKNNNQYLTLIAGLLLFIISSLRHYGFAPDPANYMNQYYSLYNIDLSELWFFFINNEGQDPFFYLISKIVILLGADHQVWFAVIAATFCFSVSKVIYKYSDEAFLSFLILASLSYIFFSLTGLRQTVALSMVLLSYPYLRERKFFPFVIVVVFGSLFHASAIIFLIAYPLANIKIGWHYVAILSIAFFIVNFSSETIRLTIEMWGWTETYIAYADREIALTYSGFIIQLLIFTFCLFYSKGVLKADKKNITLYNLLYLGLLFQLNTFVIAEFFRISMYFSIFSIILVPKAIHVEKNSNFKWAVNFAVYGALLAYFVRSGTFSEYFFYWQ